MEHRRRWNLAAGLLLVLLGAWFLAVQFVPGLDVFGNLSWPLIIIGVGVVLLILGVLAGAPGLAVPACVVGGIGGRVQVCPAGRLHQNPQLHA